MKKFTRTVTIRTITVILSLLVLITALPVVGASATDESDWEYTISNGEVTVTKYKGTATDVAIPETIEGMPVTVVSERCFGQDLENGNYTIINLYIPKTVRELRPFLPDQADQNKNGSAEAEP